MLQYIFFLKQAPADLHKLKQIERIICRCSSFEPSLHHSASQTQFLQKQGHCPNFLLNGQHRQHTNAKMYSDKGRFFCLCFCCCRFTTVLLDSKVFCNNHFWPLHGYARRVRWALSSTTKAGFKIITDPGHTNIPVHMSTHPQTQLSVCRTWLSDQSLLEQILQDLCTINDKQEHLRHVGRRNNVGEPQGKHQWFCDYVTALGMPVAEE